MKKGILFILKGALTIISLGVMTVVLPLTYIVCMIWILVCVITDKSDFMSLFEYLNDNVKEIILVPYIDGLKNFWDI